MTVNNDPDLVQELLNLEYQIDLEKERKKALAQEIGGIIAAYEKRRQEVLAEMRGEGRQVSLFDREGRP